jgi:hypothetical protein
MLSARIRRRAGDETGAVLVLGALTMVTLLMAAGLVLDIALVRTDRTQNKSAADVAVTAGLRNLELGGIPAPFRGVCEALKYLIANDTELSGMTGSITYGDGTPISGDPCSTASAQWQQLCVPNTPSSWAAYHGTAQSGRLVVDIKSGYDVNDGGFSDEPSGGTDGGSNALGGCDNLAVIVSESEQPTFARAAFHGQLSSRIRSVGRITQTFDIRAVVALLLLERNDCNSLSINGTNAAIEVMGYQTHPGIIHSDSVGNGANCNNQILNSAAVTTGGTPIYSGPGILADSAETGSPPEPGRVSVAALTGLPGSVPARAATACPSTVKGGSLDPAIAYTCAIGSSRKGRINVDVLYRSRIAALQADAATKTAGSAPAGFTTYNTCNAVPAVVTAQKVFINCNNFNNAVSFTAAGAQIIFNGSVSGSQDMTFVEPEYVYVGNGVSRTGGTLNVNTGSSADCAARFTAARSKTTKLVVARGSFSTGGNSSLHLCNTTVLMGDANSSGGSCYNGPAIPATNGVNPYDNCFGGYISLSGSGSLDWTAPNASSTAMQWDKAASQPYLDNFEDLAFWTESSSNSSSLSGGGTNNMVGVFFLPNANSFHITGNGGQVILSNAQFIVRKLVMGGNGVLKMRPNPDDAVAVPYFSNFELVR